VQMSIIPAAWLFDILASKRVKLITKITKGAAPLAIG
tara:strand:+ start:223 stop:333 length:111 start_codon:yes stop_codon:yes gene_type:complete